MHVVGSSLTPASHPTVETYVPRSNARLRARFVVWDDGPAWLSGQVCDGVVQACDVVPEESQALVTPVTQKTPDAVRAVIHVRAPWQVCECPSADCAYHVLLDHHLIEHCGGDPVLTLQPCVQNTTRVLSVPLSCVLSRASKSPLARSYDSIFTNVARFYFALRAQWNG